LFDVVDVYDFFLYTKVLFGRALAPPKIALAMISPKKWLI
jgi:hypothetical protein